jgi:hypothetical protein
VVAFLEACSRGSYTNAYRKKLVVQVVLNKYKMNINKQEKTMKINKNDTAVVTIDPQNDVLALV